MTPTDPKATQNETKNKTVEAMNFAGLLVMLVGFVVLPLVVAVQDTATIVSTVVGLGIGLFSSGATALMKSPQAWLVFVIAGGTAGVLMRLFLLFLVGI